MSQLASLSGTPAEAETAARMVNRAKAVIFFIAPPSWSRIDVRAFAELRRCVGEGCAGWADEDAASGGDHRAISYCRRTAVAEDGGVELAGQPVPAESIAELRDRHPVLARARANGPRSDRSQIRPRIRRDALASDFLRPRVAR